ncbi:thiamine phosphate synthase [Pedobacter sp. PWIIR3]
MELIVISSPTAVAKEGSCINSLFQEGLECFHIRKPQYHIHAVRKLIDDIAPEYHNRISLHQFHGLAVDYCLKRLHYTEAHRKHLTPQELTAKLNEGYILSTSVHDISLLPALENFEYVFYGPVFNSISKPGYQSSLTANFQLNKIKSKPKVIALGGVEASNLEDVFNMGFDGVAVLGTLWNSQQQVLPAFQKLKNYISSLKSENND